MTKIEHGSMILQGVINFPKKTIIHSPIVAELIATLSWRYMDQSIEREGGIGNLQLRMSVDERDSLDSSVVQSRHEKGQRWWG